jgi:hypothetical protein
MASLKDIGQLIRVPISQIEFSGGPDIPIYQIAALAEKLKQPNYRNWIPVIVQEPSLRQYSVVCNSHILLAMKAAGHEFIWVIVVPDDSNIDDQIGLLTGKLPIKVNICTADHETIFSVLSHYREHLSAKFDITIATERIIKSSGRRGWKNLQPLIALKCGFSAAKLKILANAFEAIPGKIEIKPVILNIASQQELLEALEVALTLPEVALGSVDLEAITLAIVRDPERKYWQDLKPLTKLKPGLTSAKLKGLDSIMKLEPAPPPTPNTISYLLNLMNLTALKQEAKSRNIEVPKKVTKAELVKLLSQ